MPSTRFRASVIVAIAAVTLAACTSAEPVTAADLAHGTQPSAVDVEIGGPTDVTIKRITIEPGAGTGKHCHYGNLIGVVEQGTLTHYAPIYPSGVHDYHTGDSLTEGSGYVHEGKNEGDEAVVLLVTYVTPEGQPLAESDLANCDT